MDYDRYDAFLHHIFKQTQGDAWFRPNEDNIAVGVALRVDSGEYRLFPYENLGLEPFEAAVRALNPAVAVKVRSAAVHAAFSEVAPEDRSIYIDANTRIQILDTMVDLPTADKEQSAAFIHRAVRSRYTLRDLAA
uniref:Acyl-CoA ligase AFT1-1 ) n=1 Tax=Ganoderma boninense TaxID=34458 RepID=A0A5K1K229_9APHY|nr:Acyl-CoA ligase AFT1-1 (EC (AF-toxin biosynthesis protein 1-1) [Ganoderma boninense]